MTSDYVKKSLKVQKVIESCKTEHHKNVTNGLIYLFDENEFPENKDFYEAHRIHNKIVRSLKAQLKLKVI